MTGIRRYTCGWMLWLWLLCSAWPQSANTGLWLRVERIDSLFRAGRTAEAQTLANEVLPAVRASGDILSEARLRLIVGVDLRSGGLEHEALAQLDTAAQLVESAQFKRLDSRAQRHFAAMILATLATNEMEVGQKERGVHHARLSVGWARKLDDKGLQAFILPYMGHVLLQCGHAEEAIPMLQEGKQLAHELGLPQYEKIADLDLAEAGVAVSRAAEAAPPADVAMADTAASRSKEEPVAEAKDTVVKKVVVTATEEHEERPWWQYRQVLVLGVLLALLLLGLLGWHLLRQRRFRHRISQLQEDSESRYLEGKEEERNRLAKEMHDGVSNQLLAIQMKLQTDGLTPQTMQMLSESREQVRRVSHELMPPDFAHATLDEILCNYVEELDGAGGCQLSYRSEPDDADWAAMPAEKALGIYRIVQEAVGNALKHAGATLIAVVMQQGEKTVVTVADNGQGVVEQHARGIGQRTMQERAAAIGGTISHHQRDGLHLFTLEVG